jgi:hypothetical protein
VHFRIVFCLFYLLWALHLDCLVVYEGLCYAFTELIVGDEGLVAKVFKIISYCFEFTAVAGKASTTIRDKGDFGCRQFFTKLTKLIGECAFNLSNEIIGDFGFLLFIVSKKEVHLICAYFIIDYQKLNKIVLSYFLF